MGKFTKDSLITLTTRVLQLVIGVGIYVIIARVLGPEKNGIYFLAILLPALLTIFTNFGLTSALVFHVGKNKYPLKEIFGTSVMFSISMSASAVIMGSIIIFFFSSKLFPGIEKNYLFLGLSLVPFKYFLNLIMNIWLGMQKIEKYNFIQFFNTFIFLLLIAILLLGFHFGIKAAILAEFLSLFIASTFLFSGIKKEIGGISFSLNKPLIKDFFSFGSRSYFSSVSQFLHLKIDIWMINIFLNPLAVGFYAVASLISEKIQVISQSGGTVLFPKVAAETNGQKLRDFTPLVCRNILFVTFFVVLTIFLLSYWIIVLFYSEAYLYSVLPLRILLIGTIGFSGYTVLTYDLSGRGRPIVNTYIAIASLILNILLNIIFIPKFGIIGAAGATAISYNIAFLIELFFYSKISGNRIKDIIILKKSDLQFYKKFLLKNN